jgi:hypothetical protein
MNLDRGRIPRRHPAGRTCAGMLLLAPLWPLFVAAHLLRCRLDPTH